MTMSWNGYPQLIEINAEYEVRAVAFSANGEYLLSGSEEDVRVWRVKDGERIATIPVGKRVSSLAVSKDGKYIAAEFYWEVVVWDATTYEQVLVHSLPGGRVSDVDFSPDSTRLICANDNGTATIWDVAARQKVQTLGHGESVRVAKYSPQGDRIATASHGFVRVWDSVNGRLLVDIKMDSQLRHVLVWLNNHFFVKTRVREIKQINASTGSTVSEWSVPSAANSRIALPQHGRFIAYSTEENITFWDTLTHSQLGLIQRRGHYNAIALSPDDHLLATVVGNQKILVRALPAVTEPEILIGNAALDAWKRGQLTDAETILSAVIPTSKDALYHMLASRSLVRSRLRLWDSALADAEESIKVRSSVMGYIAMFVALVGKGETHKGYRVCDIASYYFNSNIVILLLIKAIVLFMAGERDDAISRIDDLIQATPLNSHLYVVQAYMHLLCGNRHMENGDCQSAIQSFEDARIKLPKRTDRPFLIVSLISGWDLDDLAVTIQQQTCEAFFTAGRLKEAGESVLRMVDQGTNMTESVNLWVSNFMQKCLSVPENDVNAGQEATRDVNVPVPVSASRPILLKGWARLKLTTGSWKEILVTTTHFILPRWTIYQVLCECLEEVGRVADAVVCFHQMYSEISQEMNTQHGLVNWIRDFKSRSCVELEVLGDSAMDANKHDEAISLYTVALSVDPPIQQGLLVKRSKAHAGKGIWEDAFSDMNDVVKLDPHSLLPMQLLREWAKLKLTTGSWGDALAAASTLTFTFPRFTIYEVICECLEITGHVMDAVACFHHMCSERAQGKEGEQMDWTRDFKSRCCEKLGDLGDYAMNTNEYDAAISHYTAALSIEPVAPHDLLAKRSKAHAAKGMWEDALNDANELVRLDPSSPLGYERKRSALHGIGRYDDATDTFETMLLKMSQSSNPVIRDQCHQYEKTREVICTTIEDTIRDLPSMLINTTSGRLCNKMEQAAAFKLTPVFTKLVCTMTTHIDRTSISEAVEEFYRYATFSHKWEENEPLFEKVMKIVVYDLEASPTHQKLQMFCKIVREAGFNWAWSDTCCINKADHFVLQEALVSMFKWYQGSAMTIVFLLGVGRLAKRGALIKSIWNMRAWTLQEYHASKTVRFYTQDWTPYLGLDLYNHKDSLEIISEMEEATCVSAGALVALRPGLDNIREKLRLASTRQTTRVEDAAYSLLGIFSVSLPVVYGEGDQALGRLLAQLLASSGDMSILAWTGKPGSFNSCLPSSITVFCEPSSSHIPLTITQDQMRRITAGLHSLNLTSVINLYDRVNELSVPSFAGYRMKLPCLTFKLGRVLVIQNGSERVFRAHANALGVVEISAEEDLSQMGSLCLVHPWISLLLDRRLVDSATEMITEDVDDQLSMMNELPLFPHASKITSPTQETRTAGLIGRLGRTFGKRSIIPTSDTVSLPPSPVVSVNRQSIVSGPGAASPLPPSIISPVKRQRQALQFMARLKQPFGALLLAQTRQNMEEYRRVAAESLIRVQVQEITPAVLAELIDGVRTLDVL